VSDGRDNDVPAFVDLQQRLQRSGIIKNRLSILSLLFYLSERTNQVFYDIKKVAALLNE
jgi:hypothetical protein